jgi:organic radical activating enzyme
MSFHPTKCLAPYLSLAVQNYGDVCACNINKLSYQDGDQRYQVDRAPLHQAWTSATRQELISALDSGQRHSSCVACWDKEDAGAQSHRQFLHQNYGHVTALAEQPRILLIKPGNTCNAACRMCNPATSSSWYADDFKRQKQKKPGLDFKIYIKDFESVRQSFDENNENFWPTVEQWHQGLELLDIYGGEPWLIKGLWKNLAKAVDSGHARHIDIKVSTNASMFDEQYMEILSHFRSVLIKVSFDSDDKKQFEYIRHKLDFDECVVNTKKFRDWIDAHEHMSIMALCSPSILNIGDLDRIMTNLRHKLLMPIQIDNFVTGPDEYYDIRHLPKSIKQDLIERFSNDTDLAAVVEFMNQIIPGCSIWWPKFCMETDRLDRIRNQRFSDAMPDWASRLAPYWDYSRHHPEWF